MGQGARGLDRGHVLPARDGAGRVASTPPPPERPHCGQSAATGRGFLPACNQPAFSIPCQQGKGYSGAPGHVNIPGSQGIKDLGVIPEGTWTIGEVTWNKNDTRGKGENLIHLVPDAATAERVRAMGRDPNTFYIHAGKINGERTASQGCIIIPGKSERMAIRELQGAKIRVVG
ncbi:MAG TPA: tlde1 domain-containing protein [Humidesulfovibrio sp.]|uniref:tlde1 domain-containing protein n=1 Tax=Humidesulfovibrio sp. TaxID=2910988 RepID=UPI002BFDA4EE|nr:tlde1 domain-containing protein [Humidesulfovibrio sp.]HWR03844.1 tlde1 domain-containing protein [Humidesulfovibrio sp.]